MRVRLYSDIHFEFHDQPYEWIEKIDLEDVDVLVLAGDIGTCDDLPDLLSMICRKAPGKVLYTPGNHEFYRAGWDTTWAAIRRVKNKNFKCLYNEVTEIEGQRFLGSTLWFPRTMTAMLQLPGWSDCIMIPDYGKWVFQEHYKAVAFFEEHLQKGDVVFTHMLPSWRCISERFKDSSTNCFFLGDVGHLITEREPKLWMHGHTHDSVHTELSKTTIVTNPYGYRGRELNSEFQWDFDIQI